MSTDSKLKINQLLSSHPSGIVYLSSWLVKQGYSLDLQKRYRKSDWFTSIGTGAMIRSGEDVGYDGAIYALQKQAGLFIHPGGKTALALLGKSHYLELSQKRATLFGGKDERLPAWCVRYDWGIKLDYHSSSFLPPNIGLTEIELKTFSIKVSNSARALMECLYLAPKKQTLLECYQLMEGLNNLRPDLVQNLLENCTSIKVKRLFLYMAEKTSHSWFQHIKTAAIDLGSGKRSIVEDGIYNRKYKITVPKELENGEL